MTESAPATVHATSGLADVLLDMAVDAEPDSTNVVLGSTPADEFDTDLGIDAEKPVLTHFYLPDAGRSVEAVFGVDLGTPVGRGRARFLSHPQGPDGLTKRDDLAAVVLLAVPPWEAIRAFDRRGRRLDLRVLDAEPPRESLDYSR
ncbi:hypothetical protein ACFQJD_08505 [Haloplanus sp. GCM10025708]|uniref:hypothetical protein n=1 Tax=Haloferacaceae TaxID=1644056 RepID=UPI0036089E3E